MTAAETEAWNAAIESDPPKTWGEAIDRGLANLNAAADQHAGEA